MEDDGTPNGYARRIASSWNKTVAAILETAHICASAQAALSDRDRKRLIKVLAPHMGASTFSKLVQIGNDKRLQEDRVKQLLPANYTIIYPITQMDDKQLDEALARRVITPRTTRTAVERFRRGENAEINAASPVYRLVASDEFDVENEEAFREALKALAEKFGLSVEAPDDAFRRKEAAWGRKMQARQEKIEAYVRKRARAYIREKKRTMGKRWCYADDEVNIDVNSEPQDILRVLDFLGDAEAPKRWQAEAERKLPEPDCPSPPLAEKTRF